ncbi:MAG TPA: methyltransferase [Casimicrobiaceae bacterium]|nr:methyltransferase [Casimicrobiaceae bacterium]
MIAGPARRAVSWAAAALLAAALSGCASAPGGETAVATYETAIASPVRTDQDRSLDAVRHPSEFLEFAQVKPGLRVLDVSAGAGYTSQLLALAVGPGGTVFAQAPKPGPTLLKRIADHPQGNLVVVARPFDDPVPDNAHGLDLVTLVLNYHDISYLPVDRAMMNAKLFAALKPGGHFVVIDHSAQTGAGISQGKTLHRIEESVVLDEVRRAGFALETESNFLRNPADPLDTPSTGAKIPTDKFALRFVRPR